MVVLHAFNPSSQEAKAGGSLCWRPSWITKQVPAKNPRGGEREGGRDLLIHTRKSFDLCSACSAELCLNEPLGADCHAFTRSIHSFTWEEQVPKDGVMYSCQGAAFGCFAYVLYSFFELAWAESSMSSEDSL